MRFAILHMSDLHRDLADEVDNASLLDSLERDLEQQAVQDPSILPPSLCVVSGDLVYGVRADAPDGRTELARQYQQAVELLAGVADRLFGGDRERVVLIPGNHDVSYPDFAASLTRLDVPSEPHAKAGLARELFAPQSKLRWSWPELSMYRISDQEQYKRRLLQFSEAYTQFYRGTRTYPLTQEDQFDVFDFPDLQFCVIALASCYNNDPLRRAGAIHPAALTAACRTLRAVERTGWLVAASWHHSLQGGPNGDDQLDPAILQILIQAGVSLGFHGHQHIADCVDESYRIGTTPRKITVVSAGTLCAGPANLTPGVPRSYNVVEVDVEQWKVRVHQRQMVNKLFTLPVWGPGYIPASQSSYVEVDLCRPMHTRPEGLDVRLSLERADLHAGHGEWSEAVTTLEAIRDDDRARPLLSRALSELGDDRRTIALLWPPRSTAECVLIGAAILNRRDRVAGEEFLSLREVAQCGDASVLEISDRIRHQLLR